MYAKGRMQPDIEIVFEEHKYAGEIESYHFEQKGHQ